MKQSILLLVILFCFNTLTACTTKKNLAYSATEHISGDRFFYVTYRYADSRGVGRVGFFTYSSRYAYPKQSDLILQATNHIIGGYYLVQIIGIDAICEADYKGLSK